MKSLISLTVFFIWMANMVCAQKTDTIMAHVLPEVKIKVARENISKLPQTDNGFLWSGKKTEVINLQSLDANIAAINVNGGTLFH